MGNFFFEKETLSACLLLTPFFNMICKILWTIINVKWFLSNIALYNSYCWIWRITEWWNFHAFEKLQEMAHSSMLNDSCCKTSIFLTLTYSVLCFIKISIWYDFFQFVNNGGRNKTWSNIVLLYLNPRSTSFPFGAIKQNKAFLRYM